MPETTSKERALLDYVTERICSSPPSPGCSYEHHDGLDMAMLRGLSDAVRSEQTCRGDELAEAKRLLAVSNDLLRAPDNGALVCRWCHWEGSHRPNCWFAEHTAKLRGASDENRAFLAKKGPER